MAKAVFYIHAACYALVIGMLLVINLFTTPLIPWFVWPALGWGVAIFFHGASMVALGLMQWPSDFFVFKSSRSKHSEPTLMKDIELVEAEFIDAAQPRKQLPGGAQK